VTTLAIIASSLEKFATEIRNLQHTEILEVEEPFTKGQKGSSAMPHKKNPIICERVAGLARLIRGNALSSLENITTWHERDITHSSVERIIIPDSTILVDYMLNKFTNVIENLAVYPENMRKNLEKTQGLIFSERILLELIKKGISREEAYELAQKNALRVWDEKNDFKKVVLKDKKIKKYLSEKEIRDCFDLRYYLRNVDKIFAKLNIEQ
jgi:adenylosuccinate lyase